MSEQFIHETTRNTIISGKYDVVVAGGGIAGIAAALSAAREGAKTLLVEQQYMLGGLATLGLVTIYLPLCDGCGHQVSFGIAEELLQLSLQMEEGQETAKEWKKTVGGSSNSRLPRYECTYNPSVFSILAEQLLIDEGVEIRYGVQVCDAMVEDGRISALITQGRSGRTAVIAKSVIDATGDAVVCKVANAKTELFKQQNILAAWYYYTDRDLLKLQPLGACDKPDKYKTETERSETQTRYVGISDEELSSFTIDAHNAILEHFMRNGNCGKNRQLAMLPSIPQIRMTRRLVGKIEIPEPTAALRYEDSIGLIGNWKHRGPIYEIPFSCLYGGEIRNLITAGRCISALDDMWDNTRVIPACAVTGEAAGLAAAISGDFTLINIELLQERIRKRGIPLHETDLQ